MAKKTVEATQWICDGCGRGEVVLGGETPKNWLVGTVDTETRHVSTEWHAHTPNCIRGAVVAAIGPSESTKETDE